jgi:UDP:flavonoid glycosyltransferase YjiC (YdhE family)
MKVALVICGSRGDVQPMVALAMGSQRLGLYAPPEHEAMVRAQGCPFTSLGMAMAS